MSDHYYAVSFNEDHLEHHGILGMKWGVRRYQNPDGTLTEEGKKRYYYSKVYNGYRKMDKSQKEAMDIDRLDSEYPGFKKWSLDKGLDKDWEYTKVIDEYLQNFLKDKKKESENAKRLAEEKKIAKNADKLKPKKYTATELVKMMNSIDGGNSKLSDYGDFGGKTGTNNDHLMSGLDARLMYILDSIPGGNERYEVFYDYNYGGEPKIEIREKKTIKHSDTSEKKGNSKMSNYRVTFKDDTISHEKKTGVFGSGIGRQGDDSLFPFVYGPSVKPGTWHSISAKDVTKFVGMAKDPVSAMKSKVVTEGKKLGYDVADGDIEVKSDGHGGVQVKINERPRKLSAEKKVVLAANSKKAAKRDDGIKNKNRIREISGMGFGAEKREIPKEKRQGSMRIAKHEDDSDYLMHYGKKGMKWGVVNEDDVKKHKRIHKIDMNQMRVTDEKGNVIQTPGQGLSGVPAKYRWGAKKRDELQKETGHTDKMMDDWELMDYRRQFKEEANSRWGLKKIPKEHLKNMRDVGREYEDAERKRQNQRALAKLTINTDYAKIKKLVENDLKDYIAYTGNIPTSKINVLRQNVIDIKKINAGLDKSIQANYPDIDWESSLHPARKEIRSQSEYDEFVKKAKQYGLPISGIRFAKGFKPNTARHDDFLAHRQVADTSGMKKSDAEAAEKATKVRDLLKSWDNTLGTYNKANSDRTLRPDDKATIIKNIKKKQSKILAQLQEIDPKTADKIKDTRIV